MEAKDEVPVDHVPLPSPFDLSYDIQLPKYRRPGEPERYRLSAARLAMAPREPRTKLIVSVVSYCGIPRRPVLIGTSLGQSTSGSAPVEYLHLLLRFPTCIPMSWDSGSARRR